MITKLRVDQIPLAFPIGHAFTAEAKRPKPFSEAAFMDSWTLLINYNLGQIYAVVVDGVAIALLGASFTTDPFSGGMTAVEQFWYVLPEHRLAGIARELLDHFEADARSFGCTEVLMVSPCSDVVQALYERRGYSMLEQVFRKEI